MKTKRLELKNWLKDSGKKIRILRALHKKYQQAGYETLTWSSEHSKTYSDNLYSLYNLKREYRHKHIAYSELRGHTRSEIENPRENNLPNEDWISEIKKKYYDEPETLRNSA